MPAAVDHHPRLLIMASIVCFLTVGAALFTLEVPGLGIAHLIYLPVAFMALATSARAGAWAGAFATVGYLALGLMSPRFGDVKLLTVSTAVIAVTSIGFGALIGWIANSKREVVMQLHALAKRDFLTGLLNLRAFEESLAARCAFASPFALLLGDLDGLKAVNDQEGHHAGNVLLRTVADELLEELRDGEEAARVGGDEFALLFPALASPDQAQATARQLERRLERRGLWVSFGWAAYPADASTGAELFRRADERLYESKLAHTGGRSSPDARQPIRPLPKLRVASEASERPDTPATIAATVLSPAQLPARPLPSASAPTTAPAA
jgi:diguanylate cyclase (GGDEF)-like protein